MISIASKYFAASAANLVAKTEPIEKFGITTTVAFLPTILSLRTSSLSLLQPLVPTKILMLFWIAKSTIATDASGLVKSTSRSAPMASAGELCELNAE